MDKCLRLRGLAAIFCVLAFFACNEKDNDAKKLQSMGKTANEAENINDTLTALPFDFVEWGKWQAGIDLTETEDDGRYKRLYLSENAKLQQLIDKAYPSYINTHYFILESGKADCTMYVVISKEKNNLITLLFSLINIQGNEKIASLSLGGEFGVDDERKSFIITKDLEITLYDEKFFYSEKEDRVVVTEKKETGVYQIQKNCQIVKK
jgi:hypothetical protein